MADESAGRSPELRRMVEEALIIAKRAKIKYRQSQSRDAVSQSTLSDLRDAVIEAHGALEEWRDDNAVKDHWEQHNLHQIDRLLTETRTVEQAVPGSRGQRTRAREIPAINQLSAEELISILDALIQAGKELGFAPETQERTPREIGTIEDIKWLLTVRGQTPALEDLDPPEPGDGLVADGGVATQAVERPQQPEQPQVEPAVSQQSRYPFRGPFFQEISKRKDQGKDAKITVASANAETGVGKSTCAYVLELVLDTTERGFLTGEKATYDVEEFLNAYDRLPKGSALGLEEAEQIDSRRAMSQQNVDAAQRWQTRRVQEICAVLTLPKFEVLDKRMRDLVDYRVEVTARGEATIYKKQHKRFSGDVWWQELQQFQFPNMDVTGGMQVLHRQKEEFIDDAEGYVAEEDVNEQVEKEIDELKQEARNEKIALEYYYSDKKQDEIADEYGVDPSRVSQIWQEYKDEVIDR